MLLESIRLAGWGAFPTLAFGVLLLAVSLRYAMNPSRRWVPLQISLGLLTLAASGLGFVTGLIATAQTAV